MGQGMILPQGPNIHCGTADQHDKHPNPVVLNGYCDGVPVLPPFVELTVRMPLEGVLDVGEEMSHEQMLQDILNEGIGTFVLDKIEGPNVKCVLRLRWGGKDRWYPIVMKDVVGE